MNENNAKQPTETDNQAQAIAAKIRKGIIVGFRIFCLVAVIAVIDNLAGCNKTDSATQEALKGMANSPMAKRIGSLNARNAYSEGTQDGMREAADVAGRLSAPGTDMDGGLREFRDTKMKMLDLLATQAKLNPAVLAEYKRGWYGGFNSLY